MKDLRLVYEASTKDLAEDELLKLEEKWVSNEVLNWAVKF